MRPPRARVHLCLQHGDISRVARRPPRAASHPPPQSEAVCEAHLTGHEAAQQGTHQLARWAHRGPGPEVDADCVEGDDGVRQQTPPG